MVHAVIDADYVKYSAAAACESRTVRAIHKQSGREKIFKNRTEFWGNKASRDGGFLEDINKGRDTPFTFEDFIIEDIQTPEPIENVLHLAKQMMEGVLRATQCDTYVAYLGKGDSFRVDKSTILEYKGNRKDLLRPVYLDDVAEYLIKNYGAQIITSIEADDRCVMDAYADKASILAGVDKDYYGSPVNYLNLNRRDEGVIKCNQFGALRKDSGKIRGYGRMFMYHQICSGDAIDNYKANSASAVKSGEAASFKALEGCKTDAEAWAAMKALYQKLYPEPKVITGWRGDEFEIDWLYVLEENFQMARMLRWDGDEVSARDVLARFNLL